MKLIELLVKKHNEEGWEWPENADMAEAFPHEKGWVNFWLNNESASGGFSVRNWCPPQVDTVTCEQYETVLAASKEMLINKPQPVWNGDGLPPVGCECERSWCGDKWLVCRVLFIGIETVVVKLPTREASYDITSVKFRPIRTEKQRKRKDALDAIAELCRSSASNGHSAELIYQAIKEGKIPGLMEAPDDH